MHYFKVKKLSLVLLAVFNIFVVHTQVFAQSHLVVKEYSSINTRYNPPILVSLIDGPLRKSLMNVSKNIAIKLNERFVEFKQQRHLHVSFFYLSRIPSQEQLNALEQIVQQAMNSLKNGEMVFTIDPQLVLFGKSHNFVAVRLNPCQEVIDFFNQVRAGLDKVGIAYVQYPNFNAHISLGKIITQGVTQKQIKGILHAGSCDLQKALGNQLLFSVSSCILTQNLTKQPLMHFEFQQAEHIQEDVTKVLHSSQTEVFQKSMYQTIQEWIYSKLGWLKSYFAY
jgi:hypothetical protein